MLHKKEENYLKNILKKRYYDKSCTAKEAAKIISILRANKIDTEKIESDYLSIFESPFQIIDNPEFNLTEKDIQLIPNVRITLTGKDKKLLEPAYKKLVQIYCLHDELIKICRFILFNTYRSVDSNNGSEKYMIIDVKKIKEMIQITLNKL